MPRLRKETPGVGMPRRRGAAVISGLGRPRVRGIARPSPLPLIDSPFFSFHATLPLPFACNGRRPLGPKQKRFPVSHTDTQTQTHTDAHKDEEGSLFSVPVSRLFRVSWLDPRTRFTTQCGGFWFSTDQNTAPRSRSIWPRRSHSLPFFSSLKTMLFISKKKEKKRKRKTDLPVCRSRNGNPVNLDRLVSG